MGAQKPQCILMDNMSLKFEFEDGCGIYVGTLGDDSIVQNIENATVYDNYIMQGKSYWNAELLEDIVPNMPNYYILSADGIKCIFFHQKVTWIKLWDDVMCLMEKEAAEKDLWRTNTVLEYLRYKGTEGGLPLYEICYGT